MDLTWVLYYASRIAVSQRSQLAANQTPDHATIARFRVRHEQALSELFGEVLALCAKAGLVSVGVIALDGTKLHANASDRANREYQRIAEEILAEADQVDAEEDAVFGEAAAMSCPRSCRTRPTAVSACATRGTRWRPSEPARNGRSPVIGRAGC